MTSFNLCPCFCNFLYYKLSSCCKISKMTALKYIYDDACNRVYLFLLPFFISKYFSCCKLTELQYLIKYFFYLFTLFAQQKEKRFSVAWEKMKRKSVGGEDGRQERSKSQRREEVEERQTPPPLHARPWEVRAGMILEVNLRNFMCHEVMLSSTIAHWSLAVGRIRYLIVRSLHSSFGFRDGLGSKFLPSFWL